MDILATTKDNKTMPQTGILAFGTIEASRGWMVLWLPAGQIRYSDKKRRVTFKKGGHRH